MQYNLWFQITFMFSGQFTLHCATSIKGSGYRMYRKRVSHRRVSKRSKSDVSRHRQSGWKKSSLRSFCVIAGMYEPRDESEPARVVTRTNPGRVSDNAPTLPLVPSSAQAPSKEEAYEIPPTAFPRLLLRPLQVSFPIPFLPPSRSFSFSLSVSLAPRIRFGMILPKLRNARVRTHHLVRWRKGEERETEGWRRWTSSCRTCSLLYMCPNGKGLILIASGKTMRRKSR